MIYPFQVFYVFIQYKLIYLKAKILQMKRKITIALETVTGTINMFYAFLNGKRIIAADGTKKRSWTGEIESEQVKLKVRVSGINDAKYMATIDLPGTANDQSLTFQLTGGYHEFEIEI